MDHRFRAVDLYKSRKIAVATHIIIPGVVATAPKHFHSNNYQRDLISAFLMMWPLNSSRPDTETAPDFFFGKPSEAEGKCLGIFCHFAGPRIFLNLGLKCYKLSRLSHLGL